jgi:hypothetical protein
VGLYHFSAAQTSVYGEAQVDLMHPLSSSLLTHSYSQRGRHFETLPTVDVHLYQVLQCCMSLSANEEKLGMNYIISYHRATVHLCGIFCLQCPGIDTRAQGTTVFSLIRHIPSLYSRLWMFPGWDRTRTLTLLGLKVMRVTVNHSTSRLRTV